MAEVENETLEGIRSHRTLKAFVKNLDILEGDQFGGKGRIV